MVLKNIVPQIYLVHQQDLEDLSNKGTIFSMINDHWVNQWNFFRFILFKISIIKMCNFHPIIFALYFDESENLFHHQL